MPCKVLVPKKLLNIYAGKRFNQDTLTFCDIAGMLSHYMLSYHSGTCH